jgi:hypothetical protein
MKMRLWGGVVVGGAEIRSEFRDGFEPWWGRLICAPRFLQPSAKLRDSFQACSFNSVEYLKIIFTSTTAHSSYFPPVIAN